MLAEEIRHRFNNCDDCGRSLKSWEDNIYEVRGRGKLCQECRDKHWARIRESKRWKDTEVGSKST